MNTSVLDELTRIVQEKESNGGFKRGEVKEMLQTVADKYNVPFSTVSKYYYREVKGKVSVNIADDTAVVTEKAEFPLKENVPTPSNIDERVMELNDEEKKLASSLRSPELRPQRPPYVPNQEVEVEVVALKTYGAMCKILDEYEYIGLLHISEVKDTYVGDITEVFAEGDKFKAKIRQVDREGKISFTTRGMKIVKTYSAPKMNSLAEKLALIKDQIQFATETPPQKLAEHDIELSAELEEMASFISSVVGALSLKAKQRLQEVVTKHGIFKVTMEMVKVSQDFEADLGVAFINEVEKRIGGGL